MKAEQIIANIERYVAKASDKEKMYYNAAFEMPITESREMKEVHPILGLAEIVQELQKELKEKAQRETKGNSFMKRSKLVTKLVTKNWKEEYQTGFYEDIDGEKMTCCIIEGIYAFMFYDIDIPIDDKERALTLKKIMPDYKSFSICDFDIAEIKAALKIHKAKKNKMPCIIEVNGKYYDAQYFSNVVDGLGGDVKMYQSNKPFQCDVFESEHGKALLMPCRKPKQ